MLQEMLELSKGPKFGLLIQEKITRKISLCQRLQNFFEDSKCLTSLQSFEYLSTGLMISAKLFENEEDVKSFKKHSKVCNRSTNLLKSIELEILNKYSWEVDHSCLIDLGLNFICNYLYRSMDFIHFGTNTINYNTFTFLEDKLNVDLTNMKDILDISPTNFKLEVNMVQISHLSNENISLIVTPLLNSFKNCFLKLLKENCFKSNLKAILVIFLILQLKEYYHGIDYLLFNKVKSALCNLISRYPKISCLIEFY